MQEISAGISGKEGWKTTAQYLLGLLLCTVWRALRIFPNNDPIIGFALPFARRDNPAYAALFAFAAMVLFDFWSGHMGAWTWVTAITYAMVPLGFDRYFRKPQSVGWTGYAVASVVGVLFFDIITGPLMSTYLFHIPWQLAVAGQVSFTMMHLASALAYTLLLVPILDPAVAREWGAVLQRTRPFGQMLRVWEEGGMLHG